MYVQLQISPKFANMILKLHKKAFIITFIQAVRVDLLFNLILVSELQSYFFFKPLRIRIGVL